MSTLKLISPGLEQLLDTLWVPPTVVFNIGGSKVGGNKHPWIQKMDSSHHNRIIAIHCVD